jgi:hypothetical protein
LFWPKTCDHRPFVDTAAPSLADRFTEIVVGIRGALALQDTAKHPTTIGPLLNLIWLRLSRLRRRFAALFAKYRAGTLRPPRVRVRPPSASPRSAAAPDAPKLPPLIRGWAIRHLPEPWHVNVWREPLQKWLADPEMFALWQAAPQVGRLLRPLCHMLSLDMPAWLKLLRRPRKPRPPAPPRPPDASKLGRKAFGDFIAPECRDGPSGTRPPNRIGYARGVRLPRDYQPSSKDE